MATREKNVLSSVQSARLVVMIESEYAASKLNDPQFAAVATKRLGFEVNANQVGSRRSELGIPSNRDVASAEAKHTIAERLAAAEARLEDLTKNGAALVELCDRLAARLHAIEAWGKLHGHFKGEVWEVRK